MADVPDEWRTAWARFCRWRSALIGALAAIPGLLAGLGISLLMGVSGRPAWAVLFVLGAPCFGVIWYCTLRNAVS